MRLPAFAQVLAASALLLTLACSPSLDTSVGVLVPEIAASDLDGVPFKLSEYRGKVVLLDFWGNW